MSADQLSICNIAEKFLTELDIKRIEVQLNFICNLEFYNSQIEMNNFDIETDPKEMALINKDQGNLTSLITVRVKTQTKIRLGKCIFYCN